MRISQNTMEDERRLEELTEEELNIFRRLEYGDDWDQNAQRMLDSDDDELEGELASEARRIETTTVIQQTSVGDKSVEQGSEGFESSVIPIEVRRPEVELPLVTDSDVDRCTLSDGDDFEVPNGGSSTKRKRATGEGSISAEESKHPRNSDGNIRSYSFYRGKAYDKEPPTLKMYGTTGMYSIGLVYEL